jgi:hypothetical protein
MMTPNSLGSKKDWKSFSHYKRAVNLPSLSSWRGRVDVHSSSGPPHYYDYCQSGDPFAWFCEEWGAAGEPFSGLPLIYNQSEEEVLLPSDYDGYKQRALNSMLPYIKGQLSLVNSVIELKDLKTVPKTLKKINAFIDLHNIGSAVRNRSSLRKALHASADGYLQAQFNVNPMLSDITGIYTALSSVTRDLRSLIAGQGRTQKRHFRALLPNETIVDTGVFYSPVPPGANPYGCNYPCGVRSDAVRYVYTDVAVFHAEIEYNYNFTQYQTENAQLFGLLDALGVNLNPAIIWNAIPWSFVIDWVINVSKWLDQHKVLYMEPVINIHKFLTSVTYRRRILVSRTLTRATAWHDLGSDDTISDTSGSLPSITETSYRRDVGMPSSSSVQLSGLSLKEFSLGAALVITGARHKHHRAR